MNTLHFCFIVPFLFRLQRGIERSCVDLSNALVDLGHQVTLLTWESRGERTHFNIDARIRIATIPYMRYFQARWAVPFYVRELLLRNYDVVNVYFAGYGEAQALGFARRLRPFRIVYIVGYPIEQVPHRFQEFKQSRLAPHLDHIVVKSSSMAKGVRQFFERPVAVIPNGVDGDHFRREIGKAVSLREELGVGERRVILTVGALEQRKGIQHVVAALREMKPARPGVLYLVVGDGPYLEQLQSQAAKLQVQVHFAGAVKDVRPYYALADLFCLLSHGEGLPNALLEAWAMELPVVVAAQPPFDEVVPSEAGVIVRESDAPAVADAITRLLRDDALRLQMGAAGRQHVLDRYTWERVAARYIELISGHPEGHVG